MEGDKKHTGIYTCPTCNALFTCLQYYQQHVRQHAEVNGNKLHCCNHCRYSTDNQFHFNWHVMSHTGEPPHSCNVCNKPPESTLNSTSNHIKTESETDDDVSYAMTGKRSVATATNDDIVLLPSSPTSCRLSPNNDQNINCFSAANQAGSFSSSMTQVKNYQRFTQGSDEDEEEEEDDDDDDDDEEEEEEEDEEDEDDEDAEIEEEEGQNQLQPQNGTLVVAHPPTQEDDDISDEDDDEEEEVESEEDEGEAEYVVSDMLPNYEIQSPPYTKSTVSQPTAPMLPIEGAPARGRGKGNRKSRTLNLSESGVDGSLGGEMRRKFHCSHCGKSFKTKSHLQRHILTHTGEKPYHCNRCGSKFNQSSSLRNHIIAIHTKEYPHYCPQCNKGFLMPALLQKHLATSHRPK